MIWCYHTFCLLILRSGVIILFVSNVFVWLICVFWHKVPHPHVSAYVSALLLGSAYVSAYVSALLQGSAHLDVSEYVFFSASFSEDPHPQVSGPISLDFSAFLDEYVLSALLYNLNIIQSCFFFVKNLEHDMVSKSSQL